VNAKSNVLDISDIPNIQPFLFANISYVIDKIVDFYCLDKVPVDIQFIKFVKYKAFFDEKLDVNNHEKSLLRICICISNNKTDGHIMFDDKLSINLGIGSMLVHLNNINYIRVIQGEEICIIMGVNLNSL